MSQQPKTSTLTQNGQTANRFFAKNYERMSQSSSEQRFMNPLRTEVANLAHGRVLEIGAGNGLNFAFYSPDRIEQVEAVEPDTVMLEYARERATKASVPINLVQAPAEKLPFEDESFDSVVITLVFCSVSDPVQGLSEVRRVLKPGGKLLMVEHVRAHGPVVATLQNMMTPVWRLMSGNCHLNRDTEKTVIEAGFTVEHRRELKMFVMPFLVLHAVK